MAVRIRSLLVSGPVTVRLNTGTSVRLSAGQASAELPDAEVAGNPKVDKLRSRGVIEVETLGEPAGKADPEDPGDSDAAGGAAAPARGSRKRTEPTS